MDTKYKDGLFYQINLTAKYFDKLFEQVFKDANVGVCAMEHLSLCVINETPECSQRDLAKIILKDRANTGKLAKSLEAKGLIKIELKTKNNRPVKIMTVTKKGSELIESTRSVFLPFVQQVVDEVSKEKIEYIKAFLSEFRGIVAKIVKTNI